MAMTAAATEVPAVPNSASMNSGFGAYTLIDCIAAIPIGAGSLASDRITNVEKAKNTPATSPLPMALMNTKHPGATLDHHATSSSSQTPAAAAAVAYSAKSRGSRPSARWTPSVEVGAAAVEHLGEQLDQTRHVVLGQAGRPQAGGELLAR